jgi:hypothetical protein
MSSTNGNPQEIPPKAASVEFDANNMYVHLADGRIITVPVEVYKRLNDATPEQRMAFRIFGRGSGIRWDGIDEDLSVSGLLRDFGARECLPANEPSHMTP